MFEMRTIGNLIYRLVLKKNNLLTVTVKSYFIDLKFIQYLSQEQIFIISKTTTRETTTNKKQYKNVGENRQERNINMTTNIGYVR